MVDGMRQNRTLDKPRLLGLVWPFIVVVLLQAMLAGGSLYVLSAVRSYVGPYKTSGFYWLRQ